jgi:predicted metal-dependent hydrolase
MTSFTDPEFGDITVSKRVGARYIRARVGTDGRLVVSMPRFTPLLIAKKFISSERTKLRSMLANQTPSHIYEHGQQVGKSHRIAIVPTGLVRVPHVKFVKQSIILTVPHGTDITSAPAQRMLRDSVITALRKEAKAYLPRRLKELAQRYGFTYERVRFSHAGSRWGSCSSRGTISLNIALMKLPDELIDYVLLHELAHTHEMNHSPEFWAEVERLDPAYKLHRKQIKLQTPTI